MLEKSQAFELNNDELNDIVAGAGTIEGLEPFPIGSEFTKGVDNDDRLYVRVSSYCVDRNTYVYTCDSYRKNRFTGEVHGRKDMHLTHETLEQLYKKTRNMFIF